jgi:hypothetical protein
MVIVSTVGKIETESGRSGLNQLFQDFGATSSRPDGRNNLCSAEGISQLHEVTVKGSKEHRQGDRLGRADAGHMKIECESLVANLDGRCEHHWPIGYR